MERGKFPRGQRVNMPVSVVCDLTIMFTFTNKYIWTLRPSELHILITLLNDTHMSFYNNVVYIWQILSIFTLKACFQGKYVSFIRYM